MTTDSDLRRNTVCWNLSEAIAAAVALAIEDLAKSNGTTAQVIYQRISTQRIAVKLVSNWPTTHFVLTGEDRSQPDAAPVPFLEVEMPVLGAYVRKRAN